MDKSVGTQGVKKYRNALRMLRKTGGNDAKKDCVIEDDSWIFTGMGVPLSSPFAGFNLDRAIEL